MNFVGIINRPEEQPGLIMMDESHHVTSISSRCIDIFSLNGIIGDNGDVRTDQLKHFHISSWIPSWNEHMALFAKEQGHTITRRNQKMHIRLNSLSAFGSNFSYIEFLVEDSRSSTSLNQNRRSSHSIKMNG